MRLVRKYKMRKLGDLPSRLGQPGYGNLMFSYCAGLEKGNDTVQVLPIELKVRVQRAL